MSVAELPAMTAEEMVIHLFAECADSHMARLALDLLAGEKPLVIELRIKVKDTENFMWYKDGTNYGKIAAHQRERCCRNCNTKTNNMQECWGTGAHTNNALDQAIK